MSWRYLAVLFFLRTSATSITSAFHSTGDPADLSDAAGDLGDLAHHSTACPAPSPALNLQHRAALRYLRSDGVRKVVQLLRRPPTCPGTNDVTDSLLREAGMKRLGKPLVVGRRTDWVKLDRWRKEAGEDVAVLVQDGEVLMEALSRKEVKRWKNALWYAPELESSSAIKKLQFAHKFNVITTRIAVSRQNILFDEMRSAETPNRYIDPGISGLVYNVSDAWELLRRTDHRRIISNYSGPPLKEPEPEPEPEPETEDPSPVLLLRWAPPSPSQSPVLQVLRASPWFITGVYRPGQAALEPPPALLVQRSQLHTQLTAAGCATWRVQLIGADPLTGALLRRYYTEDTLPVVVTLQGGGPLGVTIRCPKLRTTLRCRLELSRHSCQWDGRRANLRRRTGRQSHGQGGSDTWSRVQRHRRQVPGSDRVERWSERKTLHHNNWRPAFDPHRSDGAVLHRSGELRRSDLAIRRRATHDQPRQRRLSGVHRTGEEVSADSNEANHPLAPKDATYSAEYRQANDPAAAYAIGRTGNYRDATYRDTYPAGYGGATYPPGAQRRQSFIPADIMLNVFPNFVSCGGGLSGCLLCAVILEAVSSKVPPEACIGPCVVGSGIACSGALANLHKEIVKARQAQARLDWR